MSASKRRPTSRFQPGMAAMYACTGASPSPFATWGLPPASGTAWADVVATDRVTEFVDGADWDDLAGCEELTDARAETEAEADAEAKATFRPFPALEAIRTTFVLAFFATVAPFADCLDVSKAMVFWPAI